jgi:hypothetical protein
MARSCWIRTATTSRRLRAARPVNPLARTKHHVQRALRSRR